MDETKRMPTRREAMKYFGMRDPKTPVPQRVLIVPSINDSIYIAGRGLRDMKKYASDKFPDVGICTGKHRGGAYTGVLSCGVGTWKSANSMDTAQALGFEKAIYFGPGMAVDKDMDPGDFVVPMQVFMSPYKETECPEYMLTDITEHLMGTLADPEVVASIEREFQRARQASYGVGYRKGAVYTTDIDLGREKVLRSMFENWSILAADRGAAVVLRRTQRDKTKAGAILYLTAKLGKQDDRIPALEHLTESCTDAGFSQALNSLMSD